MPQTVTTVALYRQPHRVSAHTHNPATAQGPHTSPLPIRYKPATPSPSPPPPPLRPPAHEGVGRIGGFGGGAGGGGGYPNPPDGAPPDAATLREQWRYAVRQYSRMYSHAWGTAILAGAAFFALGWLVKGSNPLPSRGESHAPSDSNPNPNPNEKK